MSDVLTTVDAGIATVTLNRPEKLNALTAIRELQRRQARYALVSMCIGVGQGIAAILERV